jgi:hypothetical protein
MEVDAVPVPTDEEAAAIVAALEVLWPRAVATAPEVDRRVSSWRFSGRWWSAPMPVRRNRPWR